MAEAVEEDVVSEEVVDMPSVAAGVSADAVLLAAAEASMAEAMAEADTAMDASDMATVGDSAWASASVTHRGTGAGIRIIMATHTTLIPIRIPPRMDTRMIHMRTDQDTHRTATGITTLPRSTKARSTSSDPLRHRRRRRQTPGTANGITSANKSGAGVFACQAALA